MKLHFLKQGSGPDFIILHGVFGSGDNWQNIAKKLSENFTVYTLDLRNHGASPHVDDMSYDLMVKDVIEFIQSLNQKVYLLGHSMGGRVAMMVASQYPSLIEKLIVVDVAPKPYNAGPFKKYCEALLNIDLINLKSRKEADDQLKAAIPETAVRLFLLKNLKMGDDKKWFWQVNLQALYNWIKMDDTIHLEESFWGPTLFIRGEKSDYILPQDEALILEKFPRATIETIPGAGHWLHAEKPEEFLKVVHVFMG